MKRTIIALATVIAASLTVDSVFHSAASQTSPLIGYWGSGAGGAGDNQIDFFSDGSYKMVRKISGTGVHSYNLYGLKTITGTFTVNRSTIRCHPQTLQVRNFPAATIQTSNFRNNTYISFSGSLQNNGQTLVLKDTQGNVVTYFRISPNLAL